MVEHILPQLAKAKVFSECDICNGFWHVLLNNSQASKQGSPHHLADFGGRGYQLVYRQLSVQTGSGIRKSTAYQHDCG